MHVAKPQLVFWARGRASMISALQESVELHHFTDMAQAEQALQQLGPSISGLVTSASVGAKASLLQLLPNLKVVSSFGVGVDALDLKYLKEKRIPVGYTPDVLNDCVADLTLGLMLDITRRISENDRLVRNGSWATAPAPLRHQLSTKRVGLYGMGRIGQEIAHRCAAFKMPIAYHTRHPKADLPYLHVDTLEKLAQWCDVLVVIVPATSSTQGSVDRTILTALGASGYLINVARGGIINEADLLDALEQKVIAGAAGCVL